MEKIIIKDDKEKLIPTAMFILYHSMERNFFIEVVDIDSDMNLLASKPLRKETLRSIVKELEESENFDVKPEKEIFPSNLIYMENSEYIIWHEKPRKAMLNILGEKKEYNLPSIVFKLDKESLYIYVAKNNNITETTKLYEQVFPNLYENNKICFGNCKHIKTNKISEKIDYYTKFFYESEFTADFSGAYKKYFDEATKTSFPKSFFKEMKSHVLLKNIL